jgi:hypothetical protein
MPYRTGGYQGDYSSGYSGDPQLGGLLTLGARLAGRGIRGLLGRISGRSLVRAGVGTAAVAALPAVSRTMGRGMDIGIPMPGGATIRPGAVIPGGTPFFTPGECPKGFRKNKSSYFLKNGQHVPRGSKCVRYRRMNVANTRALKRSTRRLTSFENLVKRERKALRKLAKI